MWSTAMNSKDSVQGYFRLHKNCKRKYIKYYNENDKGSQFLYS